MPITQRNNVVISGKPDGPAIVFSHGFGCDQNMWRFVAPEFEDQYKVVLFDHVGSGKSDLGSYDADKYASLSGYAADIVEILEELDLTKVIFVGHSVSSMIGVLAAQSAPERINRLVLVGPSPRYINDENYVGGFSPDDIDGLLDSLSSNFLGWSSAMAPVIIGNPDRPQLGAELTESFCRTDPAIAAQFARATFLSDNRADLIDLRQPTLILQCADDIIAPLEVGQFLHEQIPNSTLVNMKATGHCPNLSHPEETVASIKNYLQAANAV